MPNRAKFHIVGRRRSEYWRYALQRSKRPIDGVRERAPSCGRFWTQSGDVAMDDATLERLVGLWDEEWPTRYASASDFSIGEAERRWHEMHFAVNVLTP